MSLIKNWNRLTKKYLQNPFDDIVFKERPKTYGAYVLRFLSNKNLLIGVIFSTFFFVGAIIGSFAYYKIFGASTEEEYQFAEFVAFDAKVTNFSLPKGDP